MSTFWQLHNKNRCNYRKIRKKLSGFHIQKQQNTKIRTCNKFTLFTPQVLNRDDAHGTCLFHKISQNQLIFDHRYYNRQRLKSELSSLASFDFFPWIHTDQSFKILNIPDIILSQYWQHSHLVSKLFLWHCL